MDAEELRFAKVGRVTFGENGGQTRNRTTDTGIFNPLLYQLSYLAILAAGWGVAGTGKRGAIKAKRPL